MFEMKYKLGIQSPWHFTRRKDSRHKWDDVEVQPDHVCGGEQQKLRVGWSKASESDWTHTDDMFQLSLHSRAYLSSHNSSPNLACLFLNNSTERFYGLASSLHLLQTIALGPIQLSVTKMFFCWKLCSPTCVKQSMDKNVPQWKAMGYNTTAI